MKKFLSTVFLLSAIGVWGVDYTWTGDGDKSSWTDPANWTGGDSGGYPVGGDTAVIGSSIDISSPISIAEGTVLEIKIASKCTNVVSGVLSGSGDLLFSGPGYVSLAADSSSSYSGDITLTAGRVYLADPKGLGSGALRLENRSAIYVTNGMTVANDITICNSESSPNTNVESGYALYVKCPEDGAEVVFAGKITVEGHLLFSMAGAGAGQKVYFRGGVYGPEIVDGKTYYLSILGNPPTLSDRPRNSVIFDSPINAPALQLRCTHSWVDIYLASSGNSLDQIGSNRFNLYVNADDALPHDGYIWLPTPAVNNYFTGEIKLKGGMTHTFKGFDGINVYADAINVRNTQTAATTLVLNGDKDQYPYFGFVGNINLIWNPVGDYTLELPAGNASPSLSSMTGELIVSNGTMHITKSFAKATKLIADGETSRIIVDPDVDLARVTEIALTDGAELTLDSAAGLDALTSLRILDGSKMTICDGSIFPVETSVELSGDARIESSGNEISIEVSSITLDGEPLSLGFYSGVESEDGVTKQLPVLGENVSLMIITESFESATWDGGAGESDIRFSTAENWVGDVVPTFAHGNVKALFTSPVGAAAIDSLVPLKGIDYTPSTEDAQFAIDAEGDGSLKLVNGAVLSVGSADAQLTLGENLDVVVNGGLSIDVARYSTVDIAGDISGLSSADITFTGHGKLNLYGNNSFDNKIIVENGSIHAWTDTAFGSTNQETELIVPYTATDINSNTVCSVYFHGITTWENFLLSDKTYVGRVFYFPAATTNVLKGFIKKDSASVYFSFWGKTLTVFEGGFEQTRNHTDFQGVSYSYGATTDTRPHIKIVGKPFRSNVPDNAMRSSRAELRLDALKLDMCVSGNVFKHVNFKKRVTMNILTNDVFAGGSSFNSFGIAGDNFEYPVVNLHGYDISLDFIESAAITRYAMITSAAPATVTLTGDLDTTNSFYIAGDIGLAQAGSGKFSFCRAHSSTNTLSASESGTIEILEGGSWAGPLAISDSGSIIASHENALTAEDLEVNAEGDEWTLALPAGKTIHAKRFYVDGREMPGGIYGAAELGADHPLANITGGLLEVPKRGTVILIK